MNNITIRKAMRKDLVAIVELLANDILGKKREVVSESIEPTYLQAFKNILADTNQELLVVETSDGEIIATSQLSFIQYLTYQGGIRAQIEAVRTKPNYQGKGIGKTLFTYCIERAKQKGAHVVQLTSDKQRPEALKFYKKLGFIASHEGFKLHL